MAYTDPNTYYHAAPASNGAFAKDLVMALCGVHPTIPSTTRYTVIESYHSVSAVRQVPSGNLLENSTNGWEPGGATPGTNSWIVFQCEETASGLLWQGMIDLESSTTVRLFPLRNWTVGLGTDINPTLPSSYLEDTSPGLNLTPGTDPRSMVWDKGMWSVVGWEPTQRQIYMGEYDSWINDGTDLRPYALSGAVSSRGDWQRISYVNNVTQTLGFAVGGSTSAATAGPVMLQPYHVVWTSASHASVGGVPRHIGWCTASPKAGSDGTHTSLSPLGTTDRTWIRANSSGGNEWVAIRHDGTARGDDQYVCRISYDLDPPTGYPLIRTRPWLVRGRP
jgi:hypothetical protein